MKLPLFCLQILLSAFLLTGCASLVQQPKVELVRTTLLRVDTSGADLELMLDIENPNSYDISLLGYSYDLRIMSLYLTSGGSQSPLPVPANQRTFMRIPVRVLYSDMLEIIKRRPDPDRVPYRMSARLNLDTPLGEMTVPIEKNDAFAIPEEYRPGHYMKMLGDYMKMLR